MGLRRFLSSLLPLSLRRSRIRLPEIRPPGWHLPKIQVAALLLQHSQVYLYIYIYIYWLKRRYYFLLNPLSKLTEVQLCWPGCRFNGLYFLEKFRGKKIMFVGDSLSLNQWQSLACMIHSWVPKTKYSVVRTAVLSSITFQVIN